MKAKTSSKALPKTFEARMQRLQAIVTAMEKGELPLEESVELYREGMELSRACREQLDKARHDVTLYTEGQEKPFAQFSGTDAGQGEEC